MLYALAALGGAVTVWLTQRMLRPRYSWAERLIHIRDHINTHDFIAVKVLVPHGSKTPMMVARIPRDGKVPTWEGWNL